MEDIKVELNTSSNEREVEARNISFNIAANFRKGLKSFCVFFLVTLILFIWQQWKDLSFSECINSSLFANFGDFVGGVLGSIIAFYSVYMLVRTFQNQITTNANVVKANESSIETNKNTIESNKKIIEQTQLQIFDSRFNLLLSLYHKAIDSYVTNNQLHGRDAFENISLSFRDNGFENHTEYKRRSIGAVSEYRVLYTNNRRELSVHFRMLYLLCKLTAEEKMKDVLRASYSKSIRGQLSEGELLLLRYNGYTPYGQKMQQYLNQFNLLKHLPVMSLLEFSYWRRMVGQEQKISALDQLYLELKQLITQMLDIDGSDNRRITLSSRYILNIATSSSHDAVSISMIKEIHKKKGGAIKRPPEESAFDAIKDKELRSFLKDFFIEMFVYSNFCQFNGADHNIVAVKVISKDGSKIIFSVKIERKGKSLALAQRQVLPEVS